MEPNAKSSHATDQVANALNRPGEKKESKSESSTEKEKQVEQESWEKKRKNELKDLLNDNAKAFNEALPKMIPASRMFSVAIMALTKQPKLLLCTNASILGSIMQSCQLALLPNGVTGEAYLIPYENSYKDKAGNWQKKMECQFMPGYRGLLTLAYRSGMVQSFIARAVMQGDHFEYEFGLNAKCKHIPNNGDVVEIPNHITHVYTIIKTTTGGEVFDVMSRQQVDKIRANSKSADSDAWKYHYPEMAKKTGIRRVSKQIPLSADFQTAVALDESIEVIGISQHNGLLLQESSEPALKELGNTEFAEQVRFTFDDEPVIQRESRTAKKVNGATQQTLEMINNVEVRNNGNSRMHNPE